MSLFFTSPAPSGIEVVEAGMLNTTQCQKPLPVGASGSYTVMAKLLASLGAPLQLRDGEMLPPLQPKTFALLLFGEMDATTATEALPQDLSRRRTRRADSRAQIGLARNFSAAGHSAIDCKDRAGRVAGQRRGKEYHGGGYFVGSRRAAERERRKRFLPAIGI